MNVVNTFPDGFSEFLGDTAPGIVYAKCLRSRRPTSYAITGWQLPFGNICLVLLVSVFILLLGSQPAHATIQIYATQIYATQIYATQIYATLDAETGNILLTLNASSGVWWYQVTGRQSSSPVVLGCVRILSPVTLIISPAARTTDHWIRIRDCDGNTDDWLLPANSTEPLKLSERPTAPRKQPASFR